MGAKRVDYATGRPFGRSAGKAHAQLVRTARLGERTLARRGCARIRKRTARQVGHPALKTIQTELISVQRLYVDSAPLIYYVEEHPAYLETMREIVSIIDKTSLVAYSSVLTLTEVLVLPLKLRNQRLVQAYRDILIASDDFELVGVTTEIADQAAEIRAR